MFWDDEVLRFGQCWKAVWWCRQFPIRGEGRQMSQKRHCQDHPGRHCEDLVGLITQDSSTTIRMSNKAVIDEHDGLNKISDVFMHLAQTSTISEKLGFFHVLFTLRRLDMCFFGFMESWLQANFGDGTVGIRIFYPPNSDFLLQISRFPIFPGTFFLGSQHFPGWFLVIFDMFSGFSCFKRSFWIVASAGNWGHQSFGCQLDPCRATVREWSWGGERTNHVLGWWKLTQS